MEKEVCGVGEIGTRFAKRVHAAVAMGVFHGGGGT